MDSVPVEGDHGADSAAASAASLCSSWSLLVTVISCWESGMFHFGNTHFAIHANGFSKPDNKPTISLMYSVLTSLRSRKCTDQPDVI